MTEINKNENEVVNTITEAVYQSIKEIIGLSLKSVTSFPTAFEHLLMCTPNMAGVLNNLVYHIHYQATQHGWWDDWARMQTNEEELLKISQALLLINAEVAEATEELRAGKMPESTELEGNKEEGFLVELADVVIRTLDLAAAVDREKFVQVFLRKLQYNETRPSKHGGKVF